MIIPKELSLWIEREFKDNDPRDELHLAKREGIWKEWVSSTTMSDLMDWRKDARKEGALAMARHLLNPTSNCPCGNFILADTEDWQIPRCQTCYDELWPEMVALRDKYDELKEAKDRDLKNLIRWRERAVLIKQDALKLVAALEECVETYKRFKTTYGWHHLQHTENLKALKEWNEKHGG